MLVAVSSLLAGCAGKPTTSATATPPEPAAEAPPAQAPAKIPVPKRKPMPPSSASSATIGAPEPLHPEQAPSAPSTEPATTPPAVSLDGLEASAVAARLGPPQVQAESPPAVVWRYAADDCAVDVYFYKDLKSGALRALFVDVKGDDQSDQRRDVCLQRLAERHASDATPPR